MLRVNTPCNKHCSNLLLQVLVSSSIARNQVDSAQLVCSQGQHRWPRLQVAGAGRVPLGLPTPACPELIPVATHISRSSPCTCLASLDQANCCSPSNPPSGFLLDPQGSASAPQLLGLTLAPMSCSLIALPALSQKSRKGRGTCLPGHHHCHCCHQAAIAL